MRTSTGYLEKTYNSDAALIRNVVNAIKTIDPMFLDIAEETLTIFLAQMPLTRLNGTQKNIIQGFLSFPFEFIDSLPDINDKITVYNLIMNPALSSKDKTYLTSLDLLDEVEQVQSIFIHPFPQNRAEDYPYFGRSGVPEGSVVYKDLNGYPAHEPKGLLSLTARVDSDCAAPTKEDVCAYISILVMNKIVENRRIIANRHRVSADSASATGAPTTTTAAHSYGFFSGDTPASETGSDTPSIAAKSTIK